MKKISILVAKNCFMNCRGCYLDKRNGAELSALEIVELARELKDIGFSEITLSGGDPLTRKDIKEIVSGIKNLGFRIHLDTVGLPILEDNSDFFPLEKMAKAIDLIGIPYDGSDEDIISHFRVGVTNFKEKIESIIKKLNDADFNISVNTVVHPGNINNLKEIYHEITKFPKVQRWELHQFAPISRKAKSVKEVFEVEDKLFLNKIETFNNGKGIVISPKLNSRKLNFKYIDFNGDLVELRGGEKKILFNIKEQREKLKIL